MGGLQQAPSQVRHPFGLSCHEPEVGLVPFWLFFSTSSRTGFPTSNSRSWGRGQQFGWRGSQKHLLFPGWASTDCVCQWLPRVQGVALYHWLVTNSHQSHYWFYQPLLTRCRSLRCDLSNCKSMCQCLFSLLAGLVFTRQSQRDRNWQAYHSWPSLQTRPYCRSFTSCATSQVPWWQLLVTFIGTGSPTCQNALRPTLWHLEILSLHRARYWGLGVFITHWIFVLRSPSSRQTKPSPTPRTPHKGTPQWVH